MHVDDRVAVIKRHWAGEHLEFYTDMLTRDMAKARLAARKPLDDFQKDNAEYFEEMSVGGTRYVEPGSNGDRR
jgi:hypothetical protein